MWMKRPAFGGSEPLVSNQGAKNIVCDPHIIPNAHVNSLLSISYFEGLLVYKAQLVKTMTPAVWHFFINHCASNDHAAWRVSLKNTRSRLGCHHLEQQMSKDAVRDPHPSHAEFIESLRLLASPTARVKCITCSSSNPISLFHSARLSRQAPLSLSLFPFVCNAHQ